MWMLLVVVLEGNRQVAQRGLTVWPRHMGHVITFDGFHEALGYAVALRAAYRRSDWL